MKSATFRTPARVAPKTPMIRQISADNVTDPVEVFCRIRPINNPNEGSCVEVLSSKTVSLRPPPNELTTNYKSAREVQYTFQHVFGPHSTQRETYERVAQPLVEGLIKGKNGLLFTYGVTCSGKTYTMTGNQENRGIMPRCLESLFRTISDYQTKKFVFKPDRLNGFDILSEEDAMLERQVELNARFGKNHRRKDSDPEIASQASAETSILAGIDEDNMYAVFVTYVEVYNNSVYDLLEEGPAQKTLQTKIIRADEKSKCMYVNGVTEIEVKTVSEAIEAYHLGQKRKRTAHTKLNAESSRSHSIFTIRLVQAPTDSRGEQLLQDRRKITISQLSLVDLAGSERTDRTDSTGVRQREAGNINNSLMSLRKCLEILRENQSNAVQKMVPYRDSKITHLFKSYFDGEGQVRMVVCINPRRADFNETTQVMKFAEMTQEVQIARPTPMKDVGYTPGRRKANQIFKMACNNLSEMGRIDAKKLDVDIGLVYSLGPKFPEYRLISPETNEIIIQLMQHLDQRIKKRSTLLDDFSARQNQHRMQLVRTEQDINMLRSENAKLTEMLKLERNRTEIHEKQITSMENEMERQKRQIRDHEAMIKDLQTQNNQKQCKLKEMEIEQDRMKRKYESKFAAETQKTRGIFEKEFREKEDKLNDFIRTKDRQIRQIRKITSHADMENVEEPPPTPRLKERALIANTLAATPRTVKQSADATPRTLRGVPVANIRHRRSRSTDDRWIEHRNAHPVPLGTILQPYYKSRKSITKLTDAKDLINAKSSKYCLVSQGADTDGEVETRLYKGNVIPTCGGGAQVVFNDVECLKQRSPVSSPRRKRPSADEQRPTTNPDEISSRCSVGIQGKKSKY